MLTMSSTAAFTITYFKDPNDQDVIRGDPNSGKKWTPHSTQILLYNYIDFGYDMNYPDIKPLRKPEIVVMCWPRQVGKTEGTASASAALSVRYRNIAIGVMSASEGRAKDFLKRVIFFLETSPFANMIIRKTSDIIELANGSSVRSFAKSETIVGVSLTWLIIDEAALFEDDLIDGAAMPTTRTAGAYKRWGTPSIIMLSTPRTAKGRFIEYLNMGLEKREIVCTHCKDRHYITDTRYHGIQFDKYFIPDLPPCEQCGHKEFIYICNEIAVVCINPWDQPGKTREEIEAEIARRGNTPLARREILAEISDDNSGVFTEKMIEECVDYHKVNIIDPKPGKRYIVSFDIGKVHDASVISVGHMEENVLHIDYIERHPGEGLEYTQICYYVLRIIDLYCPYIVIVDATGMGSPVAEQLHNDIIAIQTEGLDVSYSDKGVKITRHFTKNRKIGGKIFSNKNNQLGFVIDYQSKLDIIDNLSNLFQRHLISFMPRYKYEVIDITWVELIRFAYEYTPNNRIKYGTQREHDDTVIALALLAWAARETPWFMSTPILGEADQFVL